MGNLLQLGSTSSYNLLTVTLCLCYRHIEVFSLCTWLMHQCAHIAFASQSGCLQQPVACWPPSEAVCVSLTEAGSNRSTHYRRLCPVAHWPHRCTPCELSRSSVCVWLWVFRDAVCMLITESQARPTLQ